MNEKKINNKEISKKADTPPQLPIVSSEEEKTSRTISSNHTLHGQIRSQDLYAKGHDFDTTEVEMGKLGLHKVSSSPNNNRPNNYSNVDNATLTGLKVDMKKKSIWEELTQSRLNIFSTSKDTNKIEDYALDENDFENSPNIKIHNSDNSVLMALLNVGKWKDVVRILGAAVIIGGVLLAILYGISYWSTKKDQVQVDSGERIVGRQDAAKTIASTQMINKDVNEVVNYQAAGRGLVYNCRGKHWACVDKSNYVKCQKLSRSGLKECMTRGVLKTNDACFETQRNFTTTNVNTQFCN